MIVPNQTIQIKWSNSTKTYFVNKGYMFTKNGDLFTIKIEDLPLKSRKKVKFICDYCNGKNQTTESSKFANYCNLNKDGVNKKHCCNSRECKNKKQSETLEIKPIPKGKSLGEKFPHLINEWSNNNEKSPLDYYAHSEFEALWRCSKGHEWKASIYKRTNNNTGCPFCSGRFATKENCLAITHPHLIKEWHPTKNKDLTPYDVKYGSNKTVWWIGECGHEWDCPISDRTLQNSGCPYCIGKRICEDNCLAHINPELAKQWHPSKNGDLTPRDVFPNSRKKAWWVCEKGHEWDSSINNRTQGNGCPYCAGQKVCLDNCLVTANPKLASEWHPTKNGNLTPYDVTKSSNKKVWWICNKNHEFKNSINDRNKGGNCPYCSGHKVNNENCLAVTNPKVAKEWNYDKNGNLTPYMVTEHSGKKVWWICEKGHEWKVTVDNRTNGNDCPYCSNKLPCEENCLATIRPDIAKDWDYSKNKLTPNNILPMSNKYIWWKCNEGHNWKTKVSTRTIYNTGCPYCSESKGEKRIRNFLTVNKVKFKPQFTFKNLIGIGGGLLRFDFAILNDDNSIKLLIEYDGEFHFKKLYHGDGHEEIVIHDQIKNEYCKNNNIKLLRIPYWESKNIEKVLEKELLNLVV